MIALNEITITDCHSFYFERNILHLLNVFNWQNDQEVMDALREKNFRNSELYFIKECRVVFSLSESAPVIRLSDIYAAIALNEKALLLCLQSEIRVYHFDSFFDLRKFLILAEIDWVIGDNVFYMNPNKIAYINNELGENILVAFDDCIQMKFLKVLIPGKFLSNNRLYVSLDAHIKRLPLTVNIQQLRNAI